jgi:hypothetical protein
MSRETYALSPSLPWPGITWIVVDWLVPLFGAGTVERTYLHE